MISHVPYVTAARQVAFGKLISELTLAGDKTTVPSSHVAMFSGSTPCDLAGTPLTKLINSSGRSLVGDGLEVDHRFSSKPTGGGYPDYYDKVTTYLAILGQYASALDAAATAATFAPVRGIEGAERIPVRRYRLKSCRDSFDRSSP